MKLDVAFVLDHAAWPAFVVETSGTIRQANQASIHFFGPRLEGEGPALAAIWSPENGLPAEQFLAHWARSATAIVPLRFVGKGAATTAFSTFICSASKDGQKRFIFQLLRESAAPANETRGQADESGLATRQKLDCALQLTRTVALDFNNALTGILGHTSLVLSKMAPDHVWRRSLLEVEKAAEKAAEIAHQLAAFSQSDKEAAGQAAGNLNELVRETVELFQTTKAASANWSLDLEPRLFSARFDEAKLQHAIIRVLENALEAAGPSCRIVVQTRNLITKDPTQYGTARLSPGHYVCVKITDNGPGIPPDFLPRVFEPFFTTKSGHRGLGLALVYGIVTNHGGGVTVAGVPGAGVTVQIYMPALKAVVKEKTRKAEDLSGDGVILMVDDEDLLLTMGESVLSAYGYRVLTANSAKRALELLAEGRRPVDLIITDLVMPRMSGREFVEKLRERCPDTPVLFMSGYARSANNDQEVYLQKPFTSQQLVAAVKQARAPDGRLS
ncbi:MAG TPA: ATP-binding protein [Verrucomicrobiae bacterium]